MLGQPLDNPESYLGRVGVLVESPAFYPALTGAEHLAVLATIAGHEQSQIPLLLKWVGTRRARRRSLPQHQSERN